MRALEMEFVEICLMIVGTLLLLLAIYLSREQEGENKPPVATLRSSAFGVGMV